jgi:ATP-binding cassette subfamily B protein
MRIRHTCSGVKLPHHAVRRADRLVVLNHGRVVEEGSHADLLARGGLYARLYQRQFRNGDVVIEGAEAG